ncbi:MAG: transcription termination/antitermination protein NusA [Deltaproteobacteria bacterium]|nr:transcription termination/antitermination protein NusA [Deltaproteobacteria bacterium]
MILELNRVLEQVWKDKGISKAILIDAIESAVLIAAKKKYGADKEIEAHFNEELGEVELFQFKIVVEDVVDPDNEVSHEKAVKEDPGVEVGDSLGMKLDASGFGRIAAQAAKQIIVQKLRDAERDNIFNEFRERKGEILNGIVKRFEHGDMIVDLGKTEAVLSQKEQVPGENYRPTERVRAYLVDVKKTSKGPNIILSRTHPGMVAKLFELEVPEIHEGIVKIKNVVREPGSRVKIAVVSEDRDIDPVGACVGMKGSRVQAVVQELKGEKIDIVEWVDDPARFVCNALSPAQIAKVIVHDAEKSMEVIVPDNQLSLAIGKRGQNVRLGAKLTGWKIDIFSESKKALAMEAEKALWEIPTVTDEEENAEGIESSEANE